MSQRTRLYSFVGVFVLVLLCGSWSHGASENEVVIGLNIPLSGPYILQGKDQLNAYNLAKYEIEKQGGILGRKIRFVVADSQSNPKVAVENVKGFIDQGADMITGGSSSAVAMAVSKLCQENKKLFLSTLTYANEVTGKDAHRYTFRETYNAWMAANALSRHLNKNFSNKKYSYITSDYAWGWSTRDSLKKFTGTENASDVLVPLGEPLGSPRYKEAVQKAVDAEADVLVLVLFGRDMMAALQQCTEMGVKQKMQIVVPNLELHMVLGLQNNAAGGILGAVPWYWEIPYLQNYSKGKAFVEAYKARYEKPPCSGAASAYTNMMLYKWAVEKVKSFDPKKIIPQLEGHSFEGLKDQETIRSWDHQAIQSVYVVKGRGDQVKNFFDVFEVLETYTGEDLAQSREENPVQLESLGS
ncbi:MAG: ABC transporter substrate-binding protein [Syntrophobacteraceae bacterium]